VSRGAREARARARDDADAASPPSVSLQPESVLTFEGQKCAGQAAILAKLTSLPFQARGGERGARGWGARARAVLRRNAAPTPSPLPSTVVQARRLLDRRPTVAFRGHPRFRDGAAPP